MDSYRSAVLHGLGVRAHVLAERTREGSPQRGRALCALLSRQAKPETISTTETEHVPRSLSLGRRLLRPIDRHSPLNSQIDWDQMVSLKMWPTAMIGELNV